MWRCPLRELDPKVPKGPRRGREIPLIGVAGVSLRGGEEVRRSVNKRLFSQPLLYPRAESNRNRQNRNLKFYPLNYGGNGLQR